MNEEELVSRLWEDFDALDYDYEQVKSLAIALIIASSKEPNYEKMYNLLASVKESYIVETQILN